MIYETEHDKEIEQEVAKAIEDKFDLHVFKDSTQFAEIDYFVTNAFMRLEALLEIKGRRYDHNDFDTVYIPKDKIDFLYEHAFKDYKSLSQFWYAIKWKDKITMARIYKEQDADMFSKQTPKTVKRKRYKDGVHVGETTGECYLIPTRRFESLDWLKENGIFR